MKSYLTYGLSTHSLEDIRRRLNSVFGIELVAHDSTYRGAYYRFGPMGQEHFILQPNHLAHEDEWIDEDHQEFPLLLYVNETTRPDEIDRLMRREFPLVAKLKREDL